MSFQIPSYSLLSGIINYKENLREVLALYFEKAKCDTILRNFFLDWLLMEGKPVWGFDSCKVICVPVDRPTPLNIQRTLMGLNGFSLT